MSKINKDALFSDETSQYRIPMEVNPGDNVTVIFRTAKDNVDGVYLISKGNPPSYEKICNQSAV